MEVSSDLVKVLSNLYNVSVEDCALEARKEVSAHVFDGFGTLEGWVGVYNVLAGEGHLVDGAKKPAEREEAVVSVDENRVDGINQHSRVQEAGSDLFSSDVMKSVFKAALKHKCRWGSKSDRLGDALDGGSDYSNE